MDKFLGFKTEEILMCLLLIVVGYFIAKMFSRSCANRVDGFSVGINEVTATCPTCARKGCEDIFHGGFDKPPPDPDICDRYYYTGGDGVNKFCSPYWATNEPFKCIGGNTPVPNNCNSAPCNLFFDSSVSLSFVGNYSKNETLEYTTIDFSGKLSESNVDISGKPFYPQKKDIEYDNLTEKGITIYNDSTNNNPIFRVRKDDQKSVIFEFNWSNLSSDQDSVQFTITPYNRVDYENLLNKYKKFIDFLNHISSKLLSEDVIIKPKDTCCEIPVENEFKMTISLEN
tara:strand:+ start:14235 stop:15089 length:855 start_codon:yes stop_codon:yes gene_type:complete